MYAVFRVWTHACRLSGLAVQAGGTVEEAETHEESQDEEAEQTENKSKLRRPKKLLDTAALDALVEKPRPLHKGLEHAMRCASEAVPLCIGGRAALEGKRIRRALDQARLTPADALTLDQQNLIQNQLLFL